MRTWLITGGTAGFGRSLGEMALAQGDCVAAAARRTATTADWAADAGDRFLAVSCDVTDEGQVAEAVAQTQAAFGGVDVLVNGAGAGYRTTVEQGLSAPIRDLFEVNVFGLAAMVRAVLPGMRSRRSGTIVNFSSFAGVVGFAGSGYYSATKFAVEGLSEALWKEVEPLGVRVLLVEPSGFRTGSDRSPSESELIPDYAATAGAVNRFLEESAGHEPGDPARAARAILSAIESERPPHRLLLGNAAFEGAMVALDARRADYLAWETVTRGTDYPAD